MTALCPTCSKSRGGTHQRVDTDDLGRGRLGRIVRAPKHARAERGRPQVPGDRVRPARVRAVLRVVEEHAGQRRRDAGCKDEEGGQLHVWVGPRGDGREHKEV